MEEDEGEKKQLGVTDCRFYVCKAVQMAVSESASPKRFGFFCLLVFMSERHLVHLFMANDIFMHTTAAEVKSRFGSTAHF